MPCEAKKCPSLSQFFADHVLRRLPLINYNITERKTKGEKLSGRYCVDKFDGNKFPRTHQMIDKYKQKDKELVEK